MGQASPELAPKISSDQQTASMWRILGRTSLIYLTLALQIAVISDGPKSLRTLHLPSILALNWIVERSGRSQVLWLGCLGFSCDALQSTVWGTTTASFLLMALLLPLTQRWCSARTAIPVVSLTVGTLFLAALMRVLVAQSLPAESAEWLAALKSAGHSTGLSLLFAYPVWLVCQSRTSRLFGFP